MTRWRSILGGVCMGLTALWIMVIAALAIFGPLRSSLGADYSFNVGAAAAWLHGQPFYPPWEVAGPYAIQGCFRESCASPILYPPVTLWLLVPFTVLPAFLWWAIPIAAVGWAFWRLRPAPLAWCVILPLVLWPPTFSAWLYGNPGMWIVAAESLGLLYGWPAVLVLLKPTLAPFALVGARCRSWWIGLAVLVLACLPFGALWWDWWRAAIVNPTNGGLLYSLQSVPLLAIPLVARAGQPMRIRPT